jgi:hypothetical protein
MQALSRQNKWDLLWGSYRPPGKPSGPPIFLPMFRIHGGGELLQALRGCRTHFRTHFSLAFLSSQMLQFAPRCVYLKMIDLNIKSDRFGTTFPSSAHDPTAAPFDVRPVFARNVGGRSTLKWGRDMTAICVHAKLLPLLHDPNRNKSFS